VLKESLALMPLTTAFVEAMGLGEALPKIPLFVSPVITDLQTKIAELEEQLQQARELATAG